MDLPSIAFLLSEAPEGNAAPNDRPRLSAVMQEVIAHLRAMGARVHFIVPERAALDIAALDIAARDTAAIADAGLQPGHDLYVLKSQSALALSIAGALAQSGAPIVNTFWSSALARDKIAATAVLAAHGVPVPPSWATGCADQLRPLLQAGPLWLKPQRGSRGEGVRRIAEPSDADSLEAPSDAHGLPLPLFAQREAPSDGHDLKVYVVGDRAWAVARPFPAHTLADKLGTPAALSPRVRDAALAVGRALGLELYGVDFLTSGGELWVVDVNAFPGYKGAPEAPRCIAEYLHQRARVRARGDIAALLHPSSPALELDKEASQ